MTVAGIFRFYNDLFKPIYADIVARGNSLPVELYFEIHAAFDHLKRFYVDGQKESESCLSAQKHLKRGILDAFKLKLKYWNNDFEAIGKSKTDLLLIDNGQFYLDLIKARQEIIQVATKARQNEGAMSSSAFDEWLNVSVKINEYYTRFNDPIKLHWATKQTRRLKVNDLLIKVAIGTAGAVAGFLAKEGLLFIQHYNRH